MSQPASLNDTQRRLVEDNLPLVHAIAHRWKWRCRNHVEHADLVQVGMLGLLDAARRYDAARNDAFAAFARQRVHGAICDALRALDPLSRRRRDGVKALQHAARDLETSLGREARDEELAVALGWTDGELAAARADLAALELGWAQTLELSEETSSSPAFTSSEPNPFEALANREDAEWLVEALGQLPEKQRLVLALYYDEELTLKEIGEVMSLTESRVCQIRSAAVAALRRQAVSRAAAPHAHAAA